MEGFIVEIEIEALCYCNFSEVYSLIIYSLISIILFVLRKPLFLHENSWFESDVIFPTVFDLNTADNC